jgi:hypothetical protein
VIFLAGGESVTGSARADDHRVQGLASKRHGRGAWPPPLLPEKDPVARIACIIDVLRDKKFLSAGGPRFAPIVTFSSAAFDVGLGVIRPRSGLRGCNNLCGRSNSTGRRFGSELQPPCRRNSFTSGWGNLRSGKLAYQSAASTPFATRSSLSRFRPARIPVG